MCCPDVSPASTFLVALMCLTAFGNFAKTSADFSGREEALIPAGCLLGAPVTAWGSSARKAHRSRSGVVARGAASILLK